VGIAGVHLAEARGSLEVLPLHALIAAAQECGRDLRLVARAPGTGGVLVVVFRRGTMAMAFSPGDGRSLGELLLGAGLISRDALTALLEERQQARTSLEQLVLERTGLEVVTIRRFLDFQARMRLLEALSWRMGSFELQEYPGRGETAFQVGLPPLHTLKVRAERRRQDLDRLLPLLPAEPRNLVVRRRRGIRVPAVNPLESDILATLQQPLLFPQLEARLLVDDDLVLDSLLRLSAARLVALEPRVRVAAGLGRALAAGQDPYLAALVEETLSSLRRTPGPFPQDALWLLVVAADAQLAQTLVLNMAGHESETVSPVEGSTGLAAVQVKLGMTSRLCMQSARLETLLRGTREAMVSRCDAVVMLRQGESEEEEERLEALRALVARSGRRRRPLMIGVDLGARLRSWREFPDAVVGVPGWQDRSSSWLLGRLLESLRNTAATTAD